MILLKAPEVLILMKLAK